MLLALIVALAAVLWASDRFLEAASDAHRRTLYAALLGGGASLVGMVAIALAVIKGIGSGPRVRKLRQLHGPTITRIMVGLLWSLGVLVVVAAVLLLTDTGSRVSALGSFSVYAALVLVVVRGARTIQVVRLVLDSEDADERAEARRHSRPPPRPRRRSRTGERTPS